MIKKGNRLFFQYSQLSNGNMAAFHYPLAYKTQVTGFHGRLQVNPLRNGIGADIGKLSLRGGSSPIVSVRTQVDGVAVNRPLCGILAGRVDDGRQR